MKMDMDKVKKLLVEFKIGDETKLWRILTAWSIDKQDEQGSSLSDINKKYKEAKQGDNRGICLKLKKFNHRIPDCRIFVEIHKIFYLDRSNKDFATELHKKYNNNSTEGKKKLGLEAIKGYLSCKNCDDSKISTIKNEILKQILCDQLPFPVKVNQIFGLDIYKIEELMKKLEPETKEEFKPQKEKEKREEMQKEEKDRLYDTIYVPREKLRLNLQDKEKIKGSYLFKINLALYAFDRNLNQESLNIIEELQNTQEFKDDDSNIHLQSKVLSNLNKEDKAIEILGKLIEREKPGINVESYNLLSAFIKRRAFYEYEKNNINDEDFVSELNKAKDKYNDIFNLNKDYYPAINVIYLQMMITRFNNKLNSEESTKEAKKIWKESNIQKELDKKDWWAFISDIEFLVLIENYDEAFDKLNNYMNDLNEEEISDFSISSTIRQLELYFKITQNKNVKNFIGKLEDIQIEINNSIYKNKED